MVRVVVVLALVGVILATLTAFVGFPDASTALNTVIRGMTIMLLGTTLLLGKPISEGQRIGMAMIGSGMIMTSTTFFDPNSPFSSWSFLLAGGGLLLYLATTYGPDVWEKISHGRWS